jgi:dienelactone hydrolase
VSSSGTVAPVLTHRRERDSRALGLRIGAIAVVLAACAVLLVLGDQERGGPAHGDVSLDRGIPATLYLPQVGEDDGDLPSPPAKGQPRPPVVVMAHGYSADRASMSGMARSLAKAGYAVLSIDLRGHGSNTRGFQGELSGDIDSAVDWAQTSPFVDGERIAVLGHSMGASAVLDFASQDSRPKAVIPVSGGFILHDAVVPAHTLLISASGDPDRIGDRQDELRGEIRAAGGSVTRTTVGGTNHLTILRSSEAIGDITTFLDPIMGLHRAAGDRPGLVDPRFATAGLYLLLALGLIAMAGSVAGRLVPAGSDAADDAPLWSGVVLVGGALLLTLPLLAVGSFDILPIGASQPIVMHFALASALLWGGRALAQRNHLGGPVGRWLSQGSWLPFRQVGAVGVAGGLAVFVLLVPLSGVFHRLVPTPERAVYWVVMSALALPFFAAFEALLRRGRPGPAAGWGVVGRLLLQVVLYAGLGLDALPSVIALVGPLLIVLYVVLEVFAAGCYAKARNTAVIAIVDAVVIGWLAVTLTPIG